MRNKGVRRHKACLLIFKNFILILKGTVKLKIFFAEKGAFIIDKKRDVFNFFKFNL